jgi:regulator of protease activity HflC (stomatin/prohibitin superfamily)
VSTSDIDAIYTSARSAIEAQVSRSVQETLNKVRSGIEIVGFRLLYVHAPDEVHDAFRDVASAQEDKLRTVNRARTFAVETVNQAKGEARAMLEQALAFKEQQIKHAEGEAASFAVRLDEYQRTPELTKFRLQLETIEEVLPGVQKFVRPGAGEMKDFDMWLLQPVGPGRGK